jgi:hypothetical protein
VEHERRKHARLVRPFEGSWRGASGANVCRIGDLSLGGCFVQSLGVPTPGQRTTVTVNFAKEHSLMFTGTVVYVEPGMGFAVRFTEMTPGELDELRQLLEMLGFGAVREQPGA